ncbi:MAG: DUF2782 domain-containing protein [Candidatus Sedimenticola sp. (ex Thyasira tokunagai)]
MKKSLLTLGLSLALPLAIAQNAPVPEPPDIPPQVESGEVLEPDVNIVEDSRGRVERYSVNGRVFMEKITPAAGPPYYLLDSNGDGVMDVREEDHPTHTAIPQWVLFSW